MFSCEVSHKVEYLRDTWRLAASPEIKNTYANVRRNYVGFYKKNDIRLIKFSHITKVMYLMCNDQKHGDNLWLHVTIQDS